jgi:hypothetical protein
MKVHFAIGSKAVDQPRAVWNKVKLRRIRAVSKE